jgi:ABC-type multidrug transport system ATPase subunit
VPAAGVEVVAHDLRKTVRGGRVVLDGVSVSIRPGELVGIVGGSGAGKTTLLELLAGVQRPDGGAVLLDGVDLAGSRRAFRIELGYVPQDDIIHLELPLARTLRYAARLRLRGDVEPAVQRVLAALDLADRADVPVGSLSGGQRKRASIAVELLTDPHLFFLDEPTSGLDPVTGEQLLASLQGLADGGATVVFTTHTMQDLERCDRVLFLASGGRLAFDGTLDEALAHFGVDRAEYVYGRLDTQLPPITSTSDPTAPDPPSRPTPTPRAGAGFLRQWAVLTQRTSETLARNPLTLGILVGSPAMVIAMFVILFRPGAFDPARPSPSAVTMIVFWITFGAFFFGITYGLLQIVTERAILRREHLVGQSLAAYLLAKVAVLLPFLVLVDVVMLAVLRGLDRLPAASLETYVSLAVTLGLEAGAALTLGLVTSAAVSNPSQATLALPMLCFPAVLFSGAILPVHVMAKVGAAISVVIPVRWSFEGIGHALDVRTLLLEGGSPLGPPLVRAYGNAGESATTTYWLYLALFVAVFLAAAWAVLARRLSR